MDRQADILILGIGICPNKPDGLLRFEHFCQSFGIEYKILGGGKVWQGGDMATNPGGGQKINELREAIEHMDNRLLVICDTFDLFPVAGPNEIVAKFNTILGHNRNTDHVIISSEIFCWPDELLANLYPEINSKYRFVNSGCIIGYRDSIYDLVGNSKILDNDDDQLFFTKKYLSGEKIILDHKCELFQTLYQVQDDIVIHKNRIYNMYTNSYPVFIHGNGPSKTVLNHIENYLVTKFDLNHNLNLDKLSYLPKIFFALYINSADMAGTKLFIKSVLDIDYHNKIVLVYDRSQCADPDKLIEPINLSDYRANVTTYVFDDFKNSDCDYYFLLEQNNIITAKNILHELLPYFDQYHRIISPLLRSVDYKYYTNYWGALDRDGYYMRSADYLELIEYKRRGLWNSPYVSGAIIISRDIIRGWDLVAHNKFSGDVNMQLCYNLRTYAIFMYMANFNVYGYIKNK